MCISLLTLIFKVGLNPLYIYALAITKYTERWVQEYSNHEYIVINWCCEKLAAIKLYINST